MTAQEDNLRRAEELLVLGRFREAVTAATSAVHDLYKSSTSECGASDALSPTAHANLQTRAWVAALQAYFFAGRHAEAETLVASLFQNAAGLPSPALMVWVLLLLERGDAQKAQKLTAAYLNIHASGACGQPPTCTLADTEAEGLVRLYAVDVLSNGLRQPQVALQWLEQASTVWPGAQLPAAAWEAVRSEVNAVLDALSAAQGAAAGSTAAQRPRTHHRHRDHRAEALQASTSASSSQQTGPASLPASHAPAASPAETAHVGLLGRLVSDLRAALRVLTSTDSGGTSSSGILVLLACKVAAALSALRRQLTSAARPLLVVWLAVGCVVLFALHKEVKGNAQWLQRRLSSVRMAVCDAITMGLALNPNPHAGVHR